MGAWRAKLIRLATSDLARRTYCPILVRDRLLFRGQRRARATDRK